MDYPPLPRGLDYEVVVREFEMCAKCHGMVAFGGRMIRANSKRIVRAIRQLFPLESGFCLNCTRDLLGQLVGIYFARAEESMAVMDTLNQNGNSSDSGLDRELALTMEGCHATVAEISNFLKASRPIVVDFAVPPTRDSIKEQHDDEFGPGKTDPESEDTNSGS